MAVHAPAVRRRALLALSVGVFCIQLEGFGLNLALPGIGRQLHTGAGALHWVVSGYLLAAGVLMLGSGRLGDQFGRRRLLVVGMVVFGGASALCAVAVSLPMLVIARVVEGAGGALIMPSGLALLTNTYPADLRGRAIGWALGLGGVATAFGPFVGAVLTASLSWRAVFWMNVPLTALGAFWASRAPESYDTEASRSVDWQGLAAGTAALAAFALLVDHGRAWGLLSVRGAVAAGVVAALVVAFARIERAAASPLVALGLFRNGPYVALTLAGAVVNTATVVFLFVVPLALQGQWGRSVMGAGVTFIAPAVLMAVAGPVAGRVRSRGAVPMMAACLGAAAVALFCLATASGLAAYVTAAVLCAAPLGLANALTLVATQAAVRPERAGEASGVTKTVITVAAGLGITLCGPVADRQRDAVASAAHDALLTTASGCLVVVSVLAIWWNTRRRVGRLRSQEHLPWETSTRTPENSRTSMTSQEEDEVRPV